MNFSAFLDMQYVRFDFGYGLSISPFYTGKGTNVIDITAPITYNQNTPNITTNSNVTTFLNIGLLGKYPIEVASGINIWPAVGIDCEIFLFSGLNGTNSLTNDYDRKTAFYAKAGLGADIKVTDNIYIVPSALWAINLNPIGYNDTAKFKTEYGSNLADYIKNNKLTAYDWLLNFNIGIAYKF